MKGVRCPSCNLADSDVIEARRSETTMRRRRQCVCGERFTTVEVVATRRPRNFNIVIGDTRKKT